MKLFLRSVVDQGKKKSNKNQLLAFPRYMILLTYILIYVYSKHIKYVLPASEMLITKMLIEFQILTL